MGHGPILERFVGKRLIGFAQDERGDHLDEPPLVLVFEDYTTMQIRAAGWRRSGSLKIITSAQGSTGAQGRTA